MIFAEDAIEELRTFGDLVRWGASRFAEAELSFGHGTENALDESFNLVRHAVQLPHELPPYMIETRLTRGERRTVVNLLVERITSRKPAPYLINEAWFAGMPFYVDERVLIPRSPIAELIASGFEPWLVVDEVNHVLDLCTGGGCIAIACAMAFPDAMVDATDISREALAVAGINVERYGLQEQVTLIESDVFNALDPQAKKYELIISNPPYVDEQDMAALTVEYQHEPSLALRAGADGLDIVKRILCEASRYLSEQGLLVVEVGNSYAALVEQFPQIPFTWPEFEHGGHGVFILTAEQVREYSDVFC
jgi:ribosomal protein L3 glutamine methyltransferase